MGKKSVKKRREMFEVLFGQMLAKVEKSWIWIEGNVIEGGELKRLAI